jgi:type I restriction enzyme M protein
MSISPQELEKYLSSALNELRGSVAAHEAVDYLTALFFLRLLSETFDKQMGSWNAEVGEGESTDFQMPPESRWPSIRQSSNQSEAVSRALHGIRVGEMNLTENRLFSSLRKLEKQPNLLRKLVEIVSAVDLSDAKRDELPALTDTLINQLAAASGAQGGEFYTNRNIADLLVSLLDPEPGKSIYDPACGTGSLLFSALKYAQSKGESDLGTFVHCQEINSRTAAIARMNAIIHHIPKVSFEVSDSLLDSGSSDNTGKFDFVITNPPTGVRLSDEKYREVREVRRADFRFGPATKVADYNFVQHTLAQLNRDGRGVMLLGLRPLFISGQEGEIRRSLVESDVIETVITLAPNLLPHTSAQSAVLILNKNKPDKRRDKIQFIFADNEYEAIGRTRNTIPVSSRRKIVETYDAFQARDQFSAIISLEEVRAQDFTLLPARYMRIGEVEVSLGSDVQWVSLGELASVFRGSPLGRHEGGSVPVIQGRDLSVSYPTIDQLEKKNVPQELPRAIYSQAGDVLLQRIGQRPRAFLLEDELSGVLISDTVYVIRFDTDDRTRARYLVEFLNSAPGQAQLTAAIGGAVVPTIGLAALRKVSVPIPNQSVIELVNNLHEVEHTLFERMNKARQLRQKLFAIENQEQVAEELRNLSIDAQVLSGSIIRADDLNFQIRNYYPYVIAYGYRWLDSIEEETKLYKEQLRIAENLMAFLGSLGLMLTAWTGALTTDDVNGFSPELLRGYWQSGISPGDWMEIGIRTGRLLRENQQHAAIVSFADIWFKGRGTKQSQFRETLQKLVTRKNDFKHDRWPQSEDEYTTAVKDIRRELQQCLHKIAFLVQYPMRLVQDSDVDWKTKKVHANTLVYVGDHPSLSKERITLSRPVSRDKLYLELKDDTLVPLYPFLSVQNCSVCKMREVFMVDRFDGSGDRVVLKSFERGHAHENDEVAKTVGKDLEHWLQNIS